MPYVYTKWKHFTVEDGLPNDHIFAVKADGAKVWIGTEDGLACYDKRTGKFRSWKQKKAEEGRPPLASGDGHRRRSQDRRRLAGPLRRRTGPVQRRPFRPFQSTQ